MFRILLFLIVLSVGYCHYSERPISRTSGVLITEDPRQIPTDKPGWQFKHDYFVAPQAEFALAARVLGVMSYSDGGSDIAPYDLALGWREMSDSALLNQLTISQGVRFWMWHTKGNHWPAPRETIEHNGSNMHIIPANDEVRHALSNIRDGDIIHLSGYLVNVTGLNGFHWNSSLTRDDVGDGACELIWVEKLEIQPRPEQWLL